MSAYYEVLTMHGGRIGMVNITRLVDVIKGFASLSFNMKNGA